MGSARGPKPGEGQAAMPAKRTLKISLSSEPGEPAGNPFSGAEVSLSVAWGLQWHLEQRL